MAQISIVSRGNGREELALSERLPWSVECKLAIPEDRRFDRNGNVKGWSPSLANPYSCRRPHQQVTYSLCRGVER